MADPFRTPEPPRQPAVTMPAVVVWLIVLMAGIHLIRVAFLSPEQDLEIILRFAFIPARYGVAADTGGEAEVLRFWLLQAYGGSLPGGTAARLWRPLTYGFLHGDWIHLAVNCLWLAAFGTAVARRFGTVRFLAFAAFGTAAGAAAHGLVHPGDVVPMVGASAAISGLMAAAARFAFRAPPAGFAAQGTRLAVPALSLAGMVRNRTVLAFLGIWFLINLGVGLASGTLWGGGAVAWQAHLGGFVVGLFAYPLFDPVRGPPRRGRPPTRDPRGS